MKTFEEIRAWAEYTDNLFESLGVRTETHRRLLKELEILAINKIVSDCRVYVRDFSHGGWKSMADRHGISRSTAFRMRKKASKQCQIL